MRDSRERVLDMLEAIQRVQRYTNRGRAAFEQDELVQTWTVYHLQILGEAAARLGGEFQQSHPQVAWARLVAMRNVLVHEYFGIDLEEVWQVVERDLPELERRLTEISKALDKAE